MLTVNNVGDVFFMFLHISMHISLGFLSRGSAEADIGWGAKTEWPFNGKLCQEYSHQKLLESGAKFLKLLRKIFGRLFSKESMRIFETSLENVWKNLRRSSKEDFEKGCPRCGFTVLVMSWISWSIGETFEGWRVRLGFPVDTECTAVQNYSFPIRPGNLVGALFWPVWLWGMAGVVWLVCWTGWAICQVIFWGDCEILRLPHSIQSGRGWG